MKPADVSDSGMTGPVDSLAADPAAVVRRHLIRHTASDAAPPDRPMPVVARQQGARIETRDGRVLLDAAGGGFGGAHPRVRAAIADQARRVALSSRILVSRPLAGAVAALAEFCPGPLSVSYLCNSGDEALDSAFKLAKGTHPGRPYALGVQGEDFGALSHGRSLGRGSAVLPGAPLRPRTVPAGSPEELLEHVDESVAAVAIAPAAPGRPLGRLPLDWWVALRERCHRTGTLLVLDERRTAPARLGRPLGTGALGIFPDVLVMGEALGADAVPVGVSVMTRAVYERVYGRRNPSLHGSTFGANPLSAVAVSAVLDAVLSDDLAARQREFEQAALRLREELTGSAELHADGSLLWVRTRGAGAARRLAGELDARDVLVRAPDADLVTLTPPLSADREDTDQMLQRLAGALKALDTEESGR